MTYGKDGKYSYEKSIEGARNSAKRRVERANEEVREVVEHDDGSVTVVRETYAVHLVGARRTLIPLDLVEHYPIVFEFDGGSPCGAPSAGEDAPVHPEIRVEGDLRDVKHDVLRRAASGTVRDADGVVRKLVVYPDELGGNSFRFRLEWWIGFLDERLQEKREAKRRAVLNGSSGSDPASSSAVEGSFCSSWGGCMAAAYIEEGYPCIELLDAIESVLRGFSERDAFIFRERFFAEREFKDIALELGCANSTLTYAMKKLLPVVWEHLRNLGY